MKKSFQRSHLFSEKFLITHINREQFLTGAVLGEPFHDSSIIPQSRKWCIIHDPNYHLISSTGFNEPKKVLSIAESLAETLLSWLKMYLSDGALH